MTMDLEGYNETDVREEFAAPLLRALGFEKGTSNDILREEHLALRYPRPFLGRKKPGRDPVLRGKADYVLSVLGVGRWVLETKAPSEPHDIDAIEQAITYARHPEISGEYVALMNGHEFLLFRYDQRADEPPLIKIETCQVEVLHDRLENILSPRAMRRDLMRRGIDQGRSLGGGLRSKENISGGLAKYDFAAWEVIECPDEAREALEKQLDPSLRILKGVQVAIEGGTIERNDQGVIIAKIRWNSPYEQMESFMAEMGLNDLSYVCLDADISEDEAVPSTFDVFSKIDVREGTVMFDMMKREQTVMEMPAVVEMRGQGIGFIEGREFKGIFQSENTVSVRLPQINVVVTLQSAGTFLIKF